jgi:hypothetical protein
MAAVGVAGTFLALALFPVLGMTFALALSRRDADRHDTTDT